MPVAASAGRALVDREQQLRRRLLAADVVSGAIAGLTGAVAAGTHDGNVILVVIGLAAGWPAVTRLSGLYVTRGLRAWASGVGEASRLLVAALLASWPIYALLRGLDAQDADEGALAAAAVAASAAGIGRAYARAAAHRARLLRDRVLVVGSGEVALTLVRTMVLSPEFGLEPAGFVDDDPDRAEALGIPHLGPLASLRAVLASAQVDRVAIAFTRGGHERLLECVRTCRSARVPVDVVPRLFELMHGAGAVEQIGRLPLVSIEPPRLIRSASISKRTLDVVGALFALVLLSPLLLGIAVAICIDSPGPVLFRQQRSGRGGRYFTLYKFRSMRTDAEMLVQQNGAIVKEARDTRLTRLGRLMRRYSLDEAPQFFNVLKGDMSLVGPRPLVCAEQDALTDEWQARRADLRPGLTGLWQVSGRSHIPFEEMITLDYQYAVGWTLARDIEILLATMPVVLSGRGAY